MLRQAHFSYLIYIYLRCTHLFFFLFRGAFRYIRLLLLVYYYQKLNLTVPQAFAKTVKRHKNKTAIIFEDQAWTFKDLEDYSNRVANYFLRVGYKPGQCVALFMENRYIHNSKLKNSRILPLSLFMNI